MTDPDETRTAVEIIVDAFRSGLTSSGHVSLGAVRSEDFPRQATTISGALRIGYTLSERIPNEILDLPTTLAEFRRVNVEGLAAYELPRISADLRAIADQIDATARTLHPGADADRARMARYEAAHDATHGADGEGE